MQSIYRGLMVPLLFASALFFSGASADGGLTVTREIELTAAAETVWKMIGNYNHLDVWHPAVATSELTGTGTAPGDIRVLTLGDGAKITEKLVAFSETDRSYTYAIETSPLPVEHYVSTLTVAAKEGGGSTVTWSSSFDAKDAPAEKATEVIAGIYDAGLGRLAGYFNAK